MMTTNGRFQVIDECYENSGGGNYVYVATVYDASLRATRFVSYNDEGNQMTTVDFIFNDIDFDDSMIIAVYNEEEQKVFDDRGEWLMDNDFEELFEYCWREWIKRDCKKFGYTKCLNVEYLPLALKRQMPAGYAEWLNDNGLLVETDGEKIIVDVSFKIDTEKHEPYIYDLMKLKEYMDHEMSTMDEGEEERETFYRRKATISFGDKIVVLDNSAAVWTALRNAIDYIIENE